MKNYLCAVISCLSLFACADSYSPPTGETTSALESEPTDPASAKLEELCEEQTGTECVDASYEIEDKDGTYTHLTWCGSCESGRARCCEIVRSGELEWIRCNDHRCSCTKIGLGLEWCTYDIWPINPFL